jgi:hypothetical protein
MKSGLGPALLDSTSIVGLHANVIGKIAFLSEWLSSRAITVLASLCHHAEMFSILNCVIIHCFGCKTF